MNQPLVSPSLWKPEITDNPLTAGRSSKGAFEVKFLIDEAIAAQLIPMAAARMQLDPHSDPDTGGYSVEGIYFETADRDVYRRTPGYSRRKFRIRRYSQGQILFLERKSKRQGIVTKRRVQFDESKLGEVLQPVVLPTETQSDVEVPQDCNPKSEMSWFRKRIDRLRLMPTLCISYDRVAFLAMESFGPIRLTIDRGLGCCALNQTGFPAKNHYHRILENQCVLELKYRESLPTAFREIIEAHKLISQPVSKFRHAIHACGLTPPKDQMNDEGGN